MSDLSRRSLDELLKLEEGVISRSARNEFASNCVRMLTRTNQENRQRELLTDAEKATHKRRELHRALAVEHMYCARNSNFVSEFNVAAMAVAYAVSSSRLVVDILGRVGPGGSYTLLKHWLKGHAGEPAHVPDGVVSLAFDNEQRLCKNYLTRHTGKVVLDIMSNVVACDLPEPESLNLREEFKINHWQRPEKDVMVKHLKVPEVHQHSNAKAVLDSYVSGRMLGVFSEQDPVLRVLERHQERSTIQCPGCKCVYDKKVRNCRNVECDVTNIREAISQETSVVREHHRSI